MERYVYWTWVQINMRRWKFRVNLTNDVVFSSLKERKKKPLCFWCYFIFIGRDPKWSQLSCERSVRLRSSLIAAEHLSPLAHTFPYMNIAYSTSGCLLNSTLTPPLWMPSRLYLWAKFELWPPLPEEMLMQPHCWCEGRISFRFHSNFWNTNKKYFFHET